LLRHQLTIFSSLVIISIIFLALGQEADFSISMRLSQVLLFPVKIITQYLQFLSISKMRIDELETIVGELKLENTELKERISYDTTGYEPVNYKLLKAQVIGRDPGNFDGFLYIDKGKADSLYINQPVTASNGFVGKVKYVGDFYSIVETIENNGIAISAFDAKTGVYGIVRKERYLIFDYIKIYDEINIGDSIYTSGMSEIFPPGILIGTVQMIRKTNDLLFKEVRLIPSVKINHIFFIHLVFGSKTKNLQKETKRTTAPFPLQNLKPLIPEFKR